MWIVGLCRACAAAREGKSCRARAAAIEKTNNDEKAYSTQEKNRPQLNALSNEHNVLRFVIPPNCHESTTSVLWLSRLLRLSDDIHAGRCEDWRWKLSG